MSLSAASAADLSQTGPNASAASLIAARGHVQEPALEFVYKVEGGKPDTITVDLAEDFSVLQQGNELYIYDFALHRLITLDDSTHSFENTSLYSMVEYFYAETYNRHVQYGALSAAKLAQHVDMLDPFWVQSNLHIVSPEFGTPKIDRRSAADGSVHFSYGGAEVASYKSSEHAMTKDEGARLARFLRFYSSIHPVIIDDIVASGHLPQHLSFEGVSTTKLPTTIWTLQSATPVKAAYPLRAGYKVMPPKLEGAVGTLVPVVQSAVAGQAPGRRGVSDYRSAIEAAMAAEKPFQAMVLALELSEQFGKPATDCADAKGCHSLKDIVAAAGADTRTPALLKALGDPTPQKDDAIKVLQAMKRGDLSNAYVLDEFLADDLVAADRSSEALPLFVGAIKGNPYLAGYYKDIGDLFRVGFQAQTAWYFYDMGRMLPRGPDAPVISEMNRYEADLAKRFPEFF